LFDAFSQNSSDPARTANKICVIAHGSRTFS
jgi:hypothetical protein